MVGPKICLCLIMLKGRRLKITMSKVKVPYVEVTSINKAIINMSIVVVNYKFSKQQENLTTSPPVSGKRSKLRHR